MAGEEHEALVGLLKALDEAGYHFTTVTPATHRRILDRSGTEPARDLRDVFGWSLPFAPDLLGSEIFGFLQEAGEVERSGDLLRSKVRVSSLSGRLFLHSAFPTDEEDSVFFGPDTYRFARFIEAELTDAPSGGRLVDMGAGSGPGGILAAGLIDAVEVTLVDLNPHALRFAQANAEAAGVDVTTVRAEGLDGVREAELIIANPPFMADPQGRSYRDGGEGLGTGLSLQWAIDGAKALTPDGRMLLYTGSPIVNGEDRLLARLADALDEAGCTLRYEELDPDIFGEDLDQPEYATAGVERIAAVGAVIRKE